MNNFDDIENYSNNDFTYDPLETLYEIKNYDYPFNYDLDVMNSKLRYELIYSYYKSYMEDYKFLNHILYENNLSLFNYLNETKMNKIFRLIINLLKFNIFIKGTDQNRYKKDIVIDITNKIFRKLTIRQFVYCLTK